MSLPQSPSGPYRVGGGTCPFRKTVGLILRNCHCVECREEGRTPTNKMDNLVQDHTCENDGYKDQNQIRKYRGVNVKEMERIKGGVHSGSMNILYLLQMLKNAFNTPTGVGMFMPSINNFANRRLKNMCNSSLGDMFKDLMAP